jgi:hypothetical protein
MTTQSEREAPHNWEYRPAEDYFVCTWCLAATLDPDAYDPQKCDGGQR